MNSNKRTVAQQLEDAVSQARIQAYEDALALYSEWGGKPFGQPDNNFQCALRDRIGVIKKLAGTQGAK